MVTTISPVAGTGSSSGTKTNGSSAQTNASSSSLMSFGIDGLLERLKARAAHGVQEALALLADGQVGLDLGVDGVRKLAGRQGRAEDLRQGGLLVARASERQLVVFLALLIHPQDADGAQVVVAAG